VDYNKGGRVEPGSEEDAVVLNTVDVAGKPIQ
jgi:hypothetical protein